MINRVITYIYTFLVGIITYTHSLLVTTNTLRQQTMIKLQEFIVRQVVNIKRMYTHLKLICNRYVHYIRHDFFRNIDSTLIKYGL